MTEVDDPFAGLGDGSARIREPERGWRSENARAAFWIIATWVSIPLLSVAWLWNAMVVHGATSEVGKAEISGPNAVRFAVVLGAISLALAYLLVLAPLLSIGWAYHVPRRRGLLLAVAMTLVATVIAIGVNQLLWAGQLFSMYAVVGEVWP